MNRTMHPINLALQGGGAHGAFTWGVLDALLEAEHIWPVAASATSAGAMNAVALAQGLMEGGLPSARAVLTRFWEGVSASMPAEAAMVSPDGRNASLNPWLRLMLNFSTQLLAPGDLNPLDINPLRDLVQRHFDFDALRRHSPLRLFLATTQANTGQLRIFTEREISADVLLASACLPSLFHPVMLDGEPYWDGGYTANPAIFPLLDAREADDTLLVLLSPLRHATTPRTAAQIQARRAEISFNAAFLREMRLLADWHVRARRLWLPLRREERSLARLRFHLMDGGAELAELSADSRMVVHRDFLLSLRDMGREHAWRWMREHGHRLGHSGSVDLQRLFGSPHPALGPPS